MWIDVAGFIVLVVCILITYGMYWYGTHESEPLSRVGSTNLDHDCAMLSREEEVQKPITRWWYNMAWKLLIILLGLHVLVSVWRYGLQNYEMRILQNCMASNVPKDVCFRNHMK